METELEYACYFQALQAVRELVRRGNPVIAAIDGRCGSGKSGLAQIMRKIFSCNVFHMDDFYLPMNKRAENWRQLPGGNMDFDRFRSEVLLPSRSGKTVAFHPFKCRSGGYGQTEYISPCTLTVAEGSYSQHPELSGLYDLKIFLTCSKEVQNRRLMAREGEHFSAFESLWIPMEEHYIQSCGIEQNSSIVLNTDHFF